MIAALDTDMLPCHTCALVSEGSITVGRLAEWNSGHGTTVVEDTRYTPDYDYCKLTKFHGRRYVPPASPLSL